MRDQPRTGSLIPATDIKSALFGLLPQAGSGLAEKQLAETARTIPVLILFHLCAAFAVSNVLAGLLPQAMLGGWQLAVLISAIAMANIFSSWRRETISTSNADLLLKFAPLGGVALSAIWAVPALIFVPLVSGDARMMTLGIVLSMLAVGIISLFRIPLAALIYTMGLTAAVNLAMYRFMADHVLLALFIGAMFASALVGIILIVHFNYQRQGEADLKLARQSQVIKLLLNDFERDTSDWLWETGCLGELTYLSPRLADILSRPDDELIGQDFAALISAAATTANGVSLVAAMSEKQDILGQTFQIEISGRTQFWQITARPLRDAAGQFAGYRGVGRDVSDQWHKDQEIRSARDLAESANAAKSQFLAIISHELRTPINAIVGFSEILNTPQSENLAPVDRKEYLATVLESARHLQGLINDILDATRIERGTLQLEDQQNDAAELIETAIKICRNQATKSNISIVAHVIDDVLLTGDLTRLKQVILNLVTNAIKFSPDGGIVNIDMSRGPENQLLIAVRDAGIGIKPEDVERVFEPFVQVDGGSTRKFGGMGLGLAIARKIARLHGGDITLNGTPGIGTEAKVLMPASRVRWPKGQTKASSQVAA